jgi:hypothetical protein
MNQEEQPLFELHYYVPENGKLKAFTERGTNPNELISVADKHRAERFEIYAVDDPTNPVEQAEFDNLVVWFDLNQKGYWAKQLAQNPELKKKQLLRSDKQPEPKKLHHTVAQRAFHPDMLGFSMNEHNTTQLPTMKKLTSFLKEWTIKEDPERFGRQIIQHALRSQFITREESIDSHAIQIATEIAENHADDEEIGSSDMTYILQEFLDGIGKQTEFVNGRLTLAGNPNAKPIQENKQVTAFLLTEEAQSQAQRGLIFSKRNKYGSKENTPEEDKWIWNTDWENKGKLPKTVEEVMTIRNTTTNPDGQAVTVDGDVRQICNNGLSIKAPKKDKSKPPKTVKEAEGANPTALYDMNKEGGMKSTAFGKDTPENAPVMEYNKITNNKPQMENKPIAEISTGLANKAADIASAKQDYAQNDPIMAARKGMQADNMSSYVNPALKAEFAAIGVGITKFGDDIMIFVPTITRPSDSRLPDTADNEDTVDIQINASDYTVNNGDIKQIDQKLLPRLQRLIQKAQADLKTPKKPAPAANELEECSTVRKRKIRMTEAQKAMLDELRLIQESIKKISGNKKLLY